jgi:hypothetical protein
MEQKSSWEAFPLVFTFVGEVSGAKGRLGGGGGGFEGKEFRLGKARGSGLGG